MIQLTKHIFGDIDIRKTNLMGVYGPRSISTAGLTEQELYDRIESPIGTASLREMADGCQNALIVTDDNTRQTPLSNILSPVLCCLERAGLRPEHINILIGLGTHRAMTADEILDKFGKKIVQKYRIINHCWNDLEQLISLGECKLGFEVVINKMVKEADLILSIGSIVPHATAGFSGGGKTIMPGICGERTIEDTHWAALIYEMKEILGNPDNRVRQAIVSVCRKAGLGMILNAVLDDRARIYDFVVGDVDAAHKKGIKISKEIYGVSIPEKADIVIAEAYPTDIDLRQAIKAVCSAGIVCKEGGVIILPAECPEGVAPQYPAFSKYGFRNPDELFRKVEAGEFDNKLLAYTLVAVGRIISKRVKAILVSPGIGRKTAESLGFLWASDLQQAFDMATSMTGPDKSIAVLKQAGEILPIVQNEN